MARRKLVLFDLDGTLIDSAPDLAGAANEQRAAHGLAPAPYAALRAMVGSGARGMVSVAFGLKPRDPHYIPMRDDFLNRYRARMLHSTRIFAQVAPVLEALDQRKLPWGIVTNKALHMAEPITRHLGLRARCSVLIGGDSTAFTKPHPEPLFEAARRAGYAPEDCVYVGDDIRDVNAGRAAGMATCAAAWGYLGEGEPVHAWGADRVLETPVELLNWLELP